MYYNIKIITKDSELALESQDRSIIENEMDFYFARIFGASTDFVSKLKVVKPSRPELVSINEFNNNQIRFQTPKTNISQNIPIESSDLTHEMVKRAEMVKNNISLAMQSASDELLKVSYDKINKSKLDNIFSTGLDTKQEENTNTPIEKSENFEFSSFQPDIIGQNELSFDADLESLVKNNDSLSINDTPFENQTDSVFNVQKNEQEETNKNTEEKTEIVETTEVPIQSIDLDTNKADAEENNNVADEIPAKEESDSSTENTSENKTENEDNDIVKKPNLSFSMFLSGFSVSDIHDEFTICAFYIKNILHQETFTMKYINSKLFQATGKIADLSIVDELIQKEYIKTIVNEDFTQYAIAPKGEEFILGKLQN